jgi:uncharacterized membrane protein
MIYLHHASFAVGLLGTLVILFGVLRGLVVFLRAEASAARGREVTHLRRDLRQSLGYYLLLGLEFLIGADIMDTLMKPELNELLALGIIVVIRTVISLTLQAEVKPASANNPLAYG